MTTNESAAEQWPFSPLLCSYPTVPAGQVANQYRVLVTGPLSFKRYLNGFNEVFLWREPGQGGDTFVSKIAS